MGTTVIAILRAGNKLAMVHLGDSRGYLMRDGVLTQVTTDHTFVQHLVDIGRITPEEAEHHPQRSVVMRVLGDFDAEVTPDMSVREARVGDRWLLCSDGLSGFVSADTIAETLRDDRRRRRVRRPARAARAARRRRRQRHRGPGGRHRARHRRRRRRPDDERDRGRRRGADPRRPDERRRRPGGPRREPDAHGQGAGGADDGADATPAPTEDDDEHPPTPPPAGARSSRGSPSRVVVLARRRGRVRLDADAVLRGRRRRPGRDLPRHAAVARPDRAVDGRRDAPTSRSTTCVRLPARRASSRPSTPTRLEDAARPGRPARRGRHASRPPTPTPTDAATAPPTPDPVAAPRADAVSRA